jgi:3-deoxy-D-manno-octulosonic acid kinase
MGETYHPPNGYTQLTVNGKLAVACQWAAPAIRELLSNSTLHDWASAQKNHEPMHGRGINYGVILPATTGTGESTPVVVRRNRHGGMFGSISGEYFLPPTRAPLELANSLQLIAAGVNTPEVIAYAIYPAFMNLVRCDVVTRRLPDGGDLPDLWRSADASARKALLAAVAELLRDLAGVGAWHADLNLKNIYIAGHGLELTAYLLDVDRVSFPGGNDIAELNFNRLARSARKWRSRWGLDFDETSIEQLAAISREIR